MAWTEKFPKEGITQGVDEYMVDYAHRFGSYLGKEEKHLTIDKQGNQKTISEKKLTTNQLRKFFGEVKRQQMIGYVGHETDFILLKPKLAYAVGRTDKGSKIKDFYWIMSTAIDCVKNETHFKNFIKFFEAVVAYHKAAEAGIE